MEAIDEKRTTEPNTVTGLSPPALHETRDIVSLVFEPSIEHISVGQLASEVESSKTLKSFEDDAIFSMNESVPMVIEGIINTDPQSDIVHLYSFFKFISPFYLNHTSRSSD